MRYPDFVSCHEKMNLGKLVGNNSSKTTRRKQLAENTRRKTRRKATRRKFSGGKLVARTENNVRRFEIIPCYEVLKYYTVNYI